MSLFLPVGYFNTRFRFSVVGLTDEMGFSIAFAPAVGETVATVGLAASLAWTGNPIGSAAQWNDEFTYEGTTTTLETVTGPVVGNFNATVVGTNAADAPPVNTSILVAKNTSLGGRSNRGRFNIPSGKIEEVGVNAAGFILTATVAALQSQVTDFLTDLQAVAGGVVLLHSDPAETPTPVDTFTVSSQVATQRRRMR